jgi:hypothetical protein
MSPKYNIFGFNPACFQAGEEISSIGTKIIIPSDQLLCYYNLIKNLF